MNDNLPSEAMLAEAIKKIRDQSAEEDAEEDLLISRIEESLLDVVDEDEIDNEVSKVLSLNDVPLEEWDAIVLSDASKFGHPLWDFTCFPHINKANVLVNFDYDNTLGLNLTERIYKHWARIVKVLLFYHIPHFSATNRSQSYSSLNSQKCRILSLLRLFQKERLYIGEFGGVGFKTLNELPREIVDKFILDIPNPRQRWRLAYTIQFWQNLSVGGLIPPEYSLFSKYVTAKDVTRLTAEMQATCSPFLPVGLDDYANIVKYCISQVEVYSCDIVWLYDTYFPTMVGGFQHVDRAELKPDGVSPGSEKGVLAFSEYKPVQHEGRPWWGLKIMERDYSNTSKSKHWGYVSFTSIKTLISSLIDACCVTIIATTGMRRSEIMRLRNTCLEQDDEGFWLRYMVFKTSYASQGDEKRIPIPALTAKAITLIERLCRESRTYGKHEFLFSSLFSGHFGRPAQIDYTNRAVTRVAEAVGVDEGIHPHRFRKNLAMYLIYQDPKNIEIVRQLFSHVSLKMTLRYVMSLPGINDEIKRIILEQNVDVLLEVLDGALSGRIGGEAGNRVRKSVEDSPEFVARLQDKGKEGLVQYVESMLEQGIKILHRTNLAICMKTPGYIEAAPCDGKNEEASKKIHPNLFACDPFGCRFAAFVESNVPSLKNEVLFHDRLVNHPYTGKDQRQFSNRRIDAVMKRLGELGAAESFSVERANG